MPYDAESGQVFHETIVRRPQRRSELGRSRVKTPRSVPHPEGARSLKDVAQRHVLCNLPEITTEVLLSLDILTLEKLWQAIQESKLCDINIFKTFVRTGRFGPAFSGKWVHIGELSGSSFQDVVEICRSGPQVEWLTNLTLLGHPRLSIADLMSLTRFDGLRSLHLDVNEEAWESPLSRILRAWSLEAKENWALKHLQMIFLVDVGRSRTPCSLQFFDLFPALDTIGILTTRGPFWMGRKQRGQEWLVDEETDFWKIVKDPTVKRSWRASVAAYVEQRRVADVAPSLNKPCIQVSCLADRTAFTIESNGTSIICLQRNRDYKPPQRKTTIRQTSIAKRKIREGKRRSVNDIIAFT